MGLCVCKALAWKKQRDRVVSNSDSQMEELEQLYEVLLVPCICKPPIEELNLYNELIDILISKIPSYNCDLESSWFPHSYKRGKRASRQEATYCH